MLGKLAFLREREKAKATLGAKFDIRKFHDAMLLAGAVPPVGAGQHHRPLYRGGESMIAAD